jgi:hypothetical protein
MNEKGFEPLMSDEVFLAGASASDVRSLWRSLARTQEVREVARGLASDPTEIRRLCRFVERVLHEDYDRQFRHPDDIAIAAGLVVLEQSPLSDVRNLFARLRSSKEPSLAWVRMMAEYCDERFAEVKRSGTLTLERRKMPMVFAFVETANVSWADRGLESRRLSLQLA